MGLLDTVTSSASNFSSMSSNALGGLSGLAGPTTFTNLTYSTMMNKYQDLQYPRAEILLGGKALLSDSVDMMVNDIHIELSAGFEASIATFRIYNVYKKTTSGGNFRFDELKSQVVMGNSVTIKLGYLGTRETVFVGFVAGVTFGYAEAQLPYIEVSCMDLKGMMMGGLYARQCTARSYSRAVNEVLQRTVYETLKSSGAVAGVEVDSTPDDPPPTTESAYTVEMVSESDYEFVVKAAKKFNYEFFVDRGKVLFRKAKKDTSNLITIGPEGLMVSFRVEYSLTSLVGTIEARAMDPGAGKVISAKSTFPSMGASISTGNSAKKLVSGGTKVYIDPTINSTTQAQSRVDSLMEQMSYRLGSLEAECIGTPEMVPGRFIKVEGLGSPADNSFYLTEVTHDFTSDGGYRTRITGCANKLQSTLAGAGNLSTGLGGMINL